MNLSSDNSTNEPTKAAGNKQKVAKQKGGKKERREREIDREREEEWERSRQLFKVFRTNWATTTTTPLLWLRVSNRLDAH